jgi:hypothetical protein
MGIAGNVLGHMRREHAGVNIVKVTGLAAGNDRYGFALIKRRLGRRSADKAKNGDEKNQNSSAHHAISSVKATAPDAAAASW